MTACMAPSHRETVIERHSASSFIIALLLSVLFPFNLILKTECDGGAGDKSQ